MITQATMELFEIIIIAIGLSMDAFAVSIGKGLSVAKSKLSYYLKVGLWFGGFQALMPLIGYLLGTSFADAVAEFDHWIAFALLAIIGGNMIKEAVGNDNDEESNADFSIKALFVLAVATSIDALAAGVSFAFLKTDIISSIIIIGITTFLFSIVGFKIGNIFGNRYKKRAELVGGVILITIGLKILIEHTVLNL